MEALYAGMEGYLPGEGQRQWSQSFYFNFYDPARRVGGFMRIGLLENLGQSNMFYVLFRDGKPAYSRICGQSPYTRGRMDTGLEVAGLRFSAVEPLRKARMRFDEGDFAMDLAFEALCPMADAIAMTRTEAGALTREIATAHLEGPGRVRGTVRLRGGEIPIDGAGFRDISCGVRNWEGLSRYRLSWPIFADGTAAALIHATSVASQDAYLKMFFDGAEWRPVAEIDDPVEFADDGMTVRALEWRFRDSLDRTCRYRGTPIFRAFIPFDGMLLSEHMMEYRRTDGTIGHGVCECGFRLPWGGQAS